MVHQTRLNPSFEISRPHLRKGANLLDLPSYLRNRIYKYLDLVRDGHIHLSVEKSTEEYTSEKKLQSTWACQCNECKHGLNRYGEWSCTSRPLFPLLLICRTLYQEVCAVLYSRNHFIISRIGPGGLNGLFNLGPLALASLTSLTIALSPRQKVCKSYCLTDCNYECDKCDGWTRGFAETPLGLSVSDDSSVRIWDELCRHLATFIPASRLRLCLLCDVDCYNTAETLVGSLHHLPLLSACSIRFSDETQPNLRHLGESAVLKLTGRSCSRRCLSRFPLLPAEIQSRILLHTDLVAPHDLQWIPEHSLLCRSRNCNQQGVKWDRKSWHRKGLRALNPCEMCIGVHEPCRDRTRPKGSSACQCWCWRFPIELFLVSRKLRWEAMCLFYSHNHFFIVPHTFHFNLWPRSKNEPLFLEQLPRDAIPYLRSLQFMIPNSAKRQEPGTKSARDWMTCIDILARYADLPRLRITIDQSQLRTEVYGDLAIVENFLNDERIWGRAQRIVEPLARLRGLKDLFVHLALPISGLEWFQLLSEKELSEKEEDLEKRVMGEDYNSVGRGKYLFEGRWFIRRFGPTPHGP